MRTYKFSSLILIAVFLIPMVVATNVFTTSANAQTTKTTEDFIYGTISDPYDIDPATVWDLGSEEVIMQICEGLYQYNMSDPSLPIIPWLASAMPKITDDGIRYNIPLRTGINFSDGLPFNAIAVKESFDRLINIITSGNSSFSSLFTPLAPTNNAIVINQTVADTNGSITFVLNYPYTPFQALLCFSGSLIISPSITTDPYYQTNLLTIGSANTHPLIGTDPFMLTNIKQDISVNFTRNPTYWGGPNNVYAPHINTLTFERYIDQDSVNSALLSGEIDMVDAPSPNYITQLNESSKIDLASGPLSTKTEYIAMNITRIPQAVRQAINYVFNYNYALTNIYKGTAIRMTSPIPVGIKDHLNMTNIPTYNITKARQILINANLTAGRSDSVALANVSDNAAWLNANNTDPLFSYNFKVLPSYYCKSVYLQFGQLLQTDLAQIGIRLTFIVNTYEYFGEMAYKAAINDFCCSGWMADYNDPQDYINPKLVSTSGWNDGFQLNDINVDENATEAILNTNSLVQQQCYNNIQKDIALNLMPWIMVAQDKTYGAWLKGVTGVQMNAMGYIHFAPISLTPNSPPSIAGYNIGLILLSFLAGIGVITIIVKKRQF